MSLWPKEKEKILQVKELERILEMLKALKGVSGILQDLTEEELEAFDDAVKRRPFFE